jgi:drug/metabolite transporter (DMT)-like permease
MRIMYACSLLFWVPVFGWYAQHGLLVWPSPLALLCIFYLAAIPSVLCNLIWFAVLRSHGAGIGAVSLFVQPLVGAALGVLALGDPLTGALIGGAALILAALTLLVLQPRATHYASESIG